MSTRGLAATTIEDNERIARRAACYASWYPDSTPADFVLSLDSHREAAGAMRVLGLHHVPEVREHVATLRRQQVSPVRCLTDAEITAMIYGLHGLGSLVDYRDAAMLSIRRSRRVIRAMTAERGTGLTPETRRWATVSGLEGKSLLFPAFRLGVMQNGVPIGRDEIAKRLKRAAILAGLDNPDSINSRSLLPCEVRR